MRSFGTPKWEFENNAASWKLWSVLREVILRYRKGERGTGYCGTPGQALRAAAGASVLGNKRLRLARLRLGLDMGLGFTEAPL